MSQLAIKKETNGTVDAVCEMVTSVIKEAGFGILTRIDFDQKIKEKLNESLPKTVILGACNPRLAYEAFKQTTDVALLIPCNIVVREISEGIVLIEAMRPTKMLELLKGVSKDDSIIKAERDLENALQKL